MTVRHLNDCGFDEHLCGEKMKFVDLVGSEMMFVELSELTFYNLVVGNVMF